MTRKLAGLAVVAAALMAATAAPAAAPEFDKAEGAGTYGPGCPVLAPPGTEFCPATERRFSFSALQRGFGERASGVFTHEHVTLDGQLRRFAGQVTCLNVLGDTAVFGGNLTESPDDVLVPFIVWVVDNGNASDGDPPDLISALQINLPEEGPIFGVAFPNVCPHPFPSPIGYLPVTSGNIVVEDESAGPASLAVE